MTATSGSNASAAPAVVGAESADDRPGALRPQVRVLLATHNGARWLDEQLDSLFSQQGVVVTLVASDDASSDETVALLERWSRTHPVVMLPAGAQPFGSAHRNFLRLIRDVSLEATDYVALSDQDDIWLNDKLQRGIGCLSRTGAHAYSSNVIAFWPDGTRRLVDKSQAQRSQDYLFGSPGPGCTFVFPRAVFERLQQWITANYEQLQHLWVHDWLIYAYIRSLGLKWHIDDQATMLYRQHGGNEIGANAGWRAAASRWQQVRQGRYRREVIAIAQAVGDRSATTVALQRLATRDRLWLMTHARNFRRRSLECLFLALFFLLMPRERAS